MDCIFFLFIGPLSCRLFSKVLYCRSQNDIFEKQLMFRYNYQTTNINVNTRLW